MPDLEYGKLFKALFFSGCLGYMSVIVWEKIWIGMMILFATGWLLYCDFSKADELKKVASIIVRGGCTLFKEIIKEIIGLIVYVVVCTVVGVIAVYAFVFWFVLWFLPKNIVRILILTIYQIHSRESIAAGSYALIAVSYIVPFPPFDLPQNILFLAVIGCGIFTGGIGCLIHKLFSMAFAQSIYTRVRAWPVW